MTQVTQLTPEQKSQLYQDGYVILKQAVSKQLVEAARGRIRSASKGENLGSAKEMTDLVNASAVTPILREAMGEFDPPTACQVGVLKPRDPGEHFNNLGYPDKDMPYYGAEVHMDGNITITAPQEAQQGTPQEIYLRHFANGPRGDLGRSPDVMGNNLGPLFQDPEMTLGLGSFTAFAFVCLNDQTEPGCGQTSIIPGAHHAMEQFFRWQRSINGHMGPEGPGWPRLNYSSPNHCGMHYLPPAIRDYYCDETSKRTPDGVQWPEPMQVLMEAGDACITVFNIPHSGSRNENGTESRKNIIFRLRNKKRQPNVVVNGVNDHPDRGQLCEWLEYEEGNNPWERSKDAMCNMWDEWQGLQQTVADERMKEGGEKQFDINFDAYVTQDQVA